MWRFSTKVNLLKIRFFYLQINLIFFPQTLVQMQTQGKSNLITLLLLKNAALIILIESLIN